MGAKLTQCPNGHYYDAEQYTSCPYCQSVTSNSFNDTDRVTDSFIPAQGSGYGYGGNGNDDRTMPIDHISERQPMRYTSPTATPTAPLNQRTAAQEAYDEGKTVPYFGGFPETDIRSRDPELQKQICSYGQKYRRCAMDRRRWRNSSGWPPYSTGCGNEQLPCQIPGFQQPGKQQKRRFCA